MAKSPDPERLELLQGTLDMLILRTLQWGAQHGHGIFAAPSLLAQELRDQYGVRAIGDADGVIERYYAISVERRIKHPAVAAITEAARERIFKRG